jgi:ubiquinone biosynthesis monooxygenase Coq7
MFIGMQRATPDIDRILRVDHAGEYGAKRIYAGQLAVLGKKPVAATIRHMAEQEQAHLDAFERLIPERGARPTALLPLWHAAGFLLGAGTALMGEKAAMACTVAVEETITEHYKDQADALPAAEAPLKETLQQFHDEEQEHHDTGVAHGGTNMTGYPVLRAMIRTGSKAAIWLSERV